MNSLLPRPARFLIARIVARCVLGLVVVGNFLMRFAHWMAPEEELRAFRARQAHAEQESLRRLH